MPRVDSNLLQDVTLRLGEAALDPGRWPQLMEDISRALGAKGATLVRSAERAPDITPHTESLTEAMARYFRDGWHEHDVRARGLALLLNGATVFTDQDIATPEERRKLPYYNEFILPCGIDWFAGIGFHADSALWIIAVQRTEREGPFEDQETRLMARLSQHLTETATLSTAVGRATLSGIANALDAFKRAAVAIDCFGMVIDSNQAMDSVLGEDIRIKNKRLVVSDPRAQEALETLDRQILTTPQSTALGAPQHIVVRRHAAPPVVVRALPVPPAAASPFLGARTILTFDPVEPRHRPTEELLTATFGLTPAEARLAAALADGKRLDSAAEELGVARWAVRTQLKSVFAKTGTHRQSELVALLSRLASLVITVLPDLDPWSLAYLV